MNKTNIIKLAITRMKSPFVLAACLLLVALGPPAAELSYASSGRGGPPGDVDFTFIAPGGIFCDFDAQIDVSGRQGVIALPGGAFLVTSPATFATLTNLSDPSKSVTLNITGPGRYSTDENGNTTVEAHGRWLYVDPSFGIELGVGDFTFVFDQNGNIIQGPTGNGQIVDVCELIS